MSQHNVPDCIHLLNEQVTALQVLFDHHVKASALLETALDVDFLQHPKSVTHGFLRALNDIIAQASTLNEDLMDAVLKIIAILRENARQQDGNSGNSGIMH